MVYGHLWQIYGSWWQIRLSFILHLLSRICKFIMLPIALSLIISSLSRKDYTGAFHAVLFFASFSLILGILTPLVKYIGMLGENRAYGKSGGTYFRRLVSADMDYFNSNLAGYLTTATRQYIDSSILLIRSVRDKYLTTIVSIVFPLGIIAWIDPWLGLVALSLSIAQAIYLIWASNRISPMRTQSREQYKLVSGLMADIISNILAVRSTAQEEVYVGRVEREMKKENDMFTERYRIQARLVAIRECFTVLFFLVLLALTVQRMSSGHIAITAAVLVVTYTATILTGIYSLSEDLEDHDDFIDKLVPAFEILDRRNAVTDPVSPVILKQVRGDIQLNNISFAYDERSVFSNLSLHIPAGQKVGIVGLSGAGKSTLAKLLLRFNDVQDGEILLDGHDIRQLKQTDLRSHIAYVPQEPLLFHASIKENVLLGKPTATEAEVKKALRISHALHFIEQLPDGLDSIVGERGVKLSGGQKQRVAIARAVLRNAQLMILDEATSALDSESERIIQQALPDIIDGRTTIVIAHRLSTVAGLDRILVMHDGQITEEGTHAELLALGGRYHSLWQKQTASA